MRVRRRHGIIRTNTIDRAWYSPDTDKPGDQPIGQQACLAVFITTKGDNRKSA